MTNMSLTSQFATILGVLSLILLLALINLVMKRRMVVKKLMHEGNIYSRPVESTEFESLAKLVPEWLADKVRDTRYEFVFGGIAAWIDYARGNLLLATTGSLIAFFGALLAASELLLFGIVGAAITVVGLQILYAAAQDAGVFNSGIRSPAPRREVIQLSAPTVKRQPRSKHL